MTTLVRNLIPTRPVIRPTDLAPYAAALMTIGVLAMLATYGLRRVGEQWPVTSATPPRVEQVERATPPALRSESFAQSITRRLRAATVGAPAARTQGDTIELIARHLTLPVANVRPEQLVRTFDEARGDRPHEAIDIMAPRGTPVMAVEDGKIAKLFWSNAGGRTIYHFDPSEKFAYYYAHLDSYADGLADGQSVRRGQVIGYVGSTGNASANAPHLHFAIFQLTSAKRWWDGAAIDPYPILRWSLDNEDTP
jgi:peptidoglycan LD-endopeptidase LytH